MSKCLTIEQWGKCERIIVKFSNCIMAEYLPREVELVSESTGLPGGDLRTSTCSWR